MELICWTAGIGLCAAYALAKADSAAGRVRGLAEFAAALQTPDQTLWSTARVRDYRAALELSADPPIAILGMPSVKLEVPVYARADELNLNRGAALIDGMAQPDHGGNLGIAGHRDGFFRVLKNVQRGDVIEIRTRLRLHRYRVTSIQVVEASDTHLLADTEEPSVTLVTCYPFYYVGSAPQRFIVSATYDWSRSGTT